MKKLFFACVAVLAFTSCSTSVSYTATTGKSAASLLSATVADLEVSPERVSATITPSKAIQRGGEENVKQAVEQEALKNGNYDLLVDPEFTITRSGFKKKITSITVSGRPARFKNFRSLNDSVWCNPVFRLTYKNAKSSGSTRRFFK